jgi:hypothetical protein
MATSSNPYPPMRRSTKAEYNDALAELRYERQPYDDDPMPWEVEDRTQFNRMERLDRERTAAAFFEGGFCHPCCVFATDDKCDCVCGGAHHGAWQHIDISNLFPALSRSSRD